jgi:hypothetical protein
VEEEEEDGAGGAFVSLMFLVLWSCGWWIKFGSLQGAGNDDDQAVAFKYMKADAFIF